MTINIKVSDLKMMLGIYYEIIVTLGRRIAFGNEIGQARIR